MLNVLKNKHMNCNSTSVMNKSHNYLLDIFKLVAAISVVFVHVRFPNPIGKYIFQFAVPLFFLISGMFATQAYIDGNKAYFKKKVFKTFKLYFICAIFYIIFYTVVHLLKSDIIKYISLGASLQNLVKFIGFNNPIYAPAHLWYILALAYAYIFFYLIISIKKNTLKNLIILFVSTISMGLIIDLFFFNLNQIVVRNWLLIGIPVFTMGMFIKLNINKLTKLKTPVLICSVILFVLLNFVRIKIFPRHDFSILIMLSSVCMIIIAEKYTNSVKKNGFTKYLGELSTYVYITHWGIMEIVRQITPTIVGIANISAWINPILTLLGSLILSYFIIKIKELLLLRG